MPGQSVRPIRVSAFVPASPEAIIEFISDSRNDPLWCENVESVELLDAEPIGPGSRFRFHQHLDRPGGARMQIDGEIEMTRLDESAVGWRVTDRFQEREITITVEETVGGARLTQETRARFRQSPGLARWVYPRLAVRVFKRQFAALARHFSP